jgi:hypothetical protein
MAEQLDHVAARGQSDHAIHRKSARRFADFLRAFASFDERTSVRLSRQFGPDSDVREAFKASTHVEFDSSAAYRIPRGLRDALTHARHGRWGSADRAPFHLIQPTGTVEISSGTALDHPVAPLPGVWARQGLPPSEI